jgi:hypothetical protein
MFEKSVGSVGAGDAASLHVLELARDYASDAKSYLGKEDLYTAFSCISYAHGLLDALKELTDKE